MAQLAALSTSNLTAQSIVRAADREAGDPGLYINASGTVDAIDAYAYIKLQVILDDLALSGDWPFRHDALSIQVSSRTTALPSDYWNAIFSDLYWIHPESGHRQPLRLIDRHVFHDRIRPSTQTDGPPEFACIVKNQGAANGGSASGVLMVDPVWSTTYWVELHYSPQAIPLATSASKPWFPYAHYLIKALAVELLTHQDDQRAIGVAQERERLYAKIRQSQGDVGQRPRALAWSRDVFRSPVRI